MAGILLHADSGALATPAATVRKVMLQAIIPANHQVKVKAWGVFFQGVSAADSPVLVQLTSSAAGTTPTGGTRTLKILSQPFTPQTTVANAWAVAPVAGTVIDQEYVHGQSGWARVYSMGDEPMQGGTGITYLAIEITPGATWTGTPNAVGWMDIEE